MSEPVKRYSFKGAAGLYVYEGDFDALAQRCRELEDYIDNHSAVTADYIARLQRTLDERDALRAEVERLRQALRSVIVAAGGSAAPEVSTEFLEQAPLEVLALRGKAEKLARDRDQAWECVTQATDRLAVANADTARLQWLAGNMRLMSGHKATGHYQLPELVEWVESAREGCTLDDLRAALDAMPEAI